MEPKEHHLDALRELLNIGVGNGANVLSTMLGTRINLQVPDIKILDPGDTSELIEELGLDDFSSVILGFEGPFAGSAGILFPTDSASRLVSAVAGDSADGKSLDALRSGTLTEIGNIVLNGVMGSFGNILHKDLSYIVPYYFEGIVSDLLHGEMKSDTVLMLAKTLFAVEQMHIDGTIILLLEVGSFDTFANAIDGFLSKGGAPS